MARKLKYNDEEGGMAKAQLQKIEMYAAKLNEMIHPEDELEGWVQNKLSVVAAYMGDVKHYLDYALQNEPEYKEFANGGMMDKPRYWEVEFTWDAADDESRKVNVMAESVSDAEEQVKKKFGPYYEGLKVVEVEEDKEITWEEYEKRPKKFEVESTTDYDVIEADDEEEAKKEWLRRRKGDSYKSEIIGVRRKFSEGGLAENETFVKSAIESASGDKISKKVLPAEYDNSDSKMYCSIKNPKVIYYIGKENQIIKYDGVTGERYPIGDLRHYDTKFADGGMVYDIEWKDEEGDTYEASFKDLQEAKEEIRKIRDEGGRIIQTWKYSDGEYVGSFADGGSVKDLVKHQGVKEQVIKQAFFAGGTNGSKAAMGKDFETYEDWLKKHKIKHHSIYRKAFEDGGKAGFNIVKGTYSETFEQWKEKNYASGGMMKYEGSTEAEDFKEAEEYIGKDVWETLSKEDKLNATQYLKAKGVIGFYGQEEELADFMASQYAKGGSLYRGMRPSPSISATAYPRGFKMIGNDGNMWEISLDSRGVHRWTKSSSATRNDRTEQKAKIREAIELLESMRDEIDVEDEIATLKKLQ